MLCRVEKNRHIKIIQSMVCRPFAMLTSCATVRHTETRMHCTSASASSEIKTRNGLLFNWICIYLIEYNSFCCRFPHTDKRTHSPVNDQDTLATNSYTFLQFVASSNQHNYTTHSSSAGPPPRYRSHLMPSFAFYFRTLHGFIVCCCMNVSVFLSFSSSSHCRWAVYPFRVFICARSENYTDS